MDEQITLEWNHRVSEIRETKTVRRTASDAECAIVSEIFGNAICRALEATYEIRPVSQGRYRMVGDVLARVEQTCGVTLDPVEQLIDERFDVEFRSDARRLAGQEADFDALAGDDPEPIEHNEIRAGRFICEVVASAIDPFPRAADAELEHVTAGDATGDATGDAAGPANPFAVLGQLKSPPKLS